MIYQSKESAEHWAAILNSRKGYPHAEAIQTVQGWTVLASYKVGGR
jgi:hypothetical protein